MNQTRVALIIPIYNAEKDIPALFPAIMRQTLKPDQILVIDSSSTDKSKELLAPFPVTIHTIKKTEFDHGGTRKLATTLVDADVYIYLTQDAVPAEENSFKNLLTLLLSQENIACVYGRQLPKKNATPLSKHLRLFNYPTETQIRSYADKKRYGVKTYFSSNSFAAYKKTALEKIGNFPDHLITGEDAYVAAKFLKKDFLVAYAADATVFHSHNLTPMEEFHRYFSIGVFHGRENWIIKDFTSATGEGLRFVKSEIQFLIREKKLHWIPRALLSSYVKYLGYHLGLREKIIPHFLKKEIGINKSYWLKNTVKTS